jgi:hypothetical protein
MPRAAIESIDSGFGPRNGGIMDWKMMCREVFMRRMSCAVLVFAFLVFFMTAMSSAQSTDTNFSTGPQYLINPGSTPELLRSIATPSLSLFAPLAPTASPEEGSGEPHTPAFPDLQTQAQVDQIYWGVSDVSVGAQSAENTPVSGEVELSSQSAVSLPPSFFNAGVTGMMDAEALRESGYGVPLGDVAAFWKVNKRQATRAYTNADITRLHGG